MSVTKISAILVTVLLCTVFVQCDILDSVEPYYLAWYQLVANVLKRFDGAGTRFLNTKTKEQQEINSIQDQDIMTSPLIKTETGWLQGRVRYAKNTKFPFYSFQGVPYAAPPVGKLRFKPTAPVEPWKGVKEAFIESDKCPQRDPYFGFVGSEDCLYLNIYTAHLPDNTSKSLEEPKAVMFWLHAGDSFMGGGNNNSGIYGPDYLVETDVVLVTINYRLGVLGFLSTEDMAAPGNNGIRDQIEALKWVQNNIAFFGGDPNRVTIFGQSSGASYVDILYQSTQAKGLFHRGIMLSGSSITKWAMTEKPRENAFQYGHMLSIFTENSTVLVEEISKLSTWVLLSTSLVSTYRVNYFPWNGFVFHPTIEPPHKDAIISESPLVALSKGNFQKLPLMSGYTAREAAFLINFLRPAVLRLFFSRYFEIMVPSSLNVPVGSKDIKAVIKRIKQFYFPNKDILPLQRLLDCVGDRDFKLGIWKAVKLHAMYNPNVYMYRFSFDGNFNFFKRLFNVVNVKGASHTEELGYLFNIKGIDDEMESNSTITRTRFLKLITNFAKTGNPTPESDNVLQNIIWPTVNDTKTENIHYLDVDANLTTNVNPDNVPMKFWEDLFNEYMRPPYFSY